jgi:microcystin-dependent protein
MSEPFIAEMRIFSFNFPPKGWSLCNGALLPINQNQALFSLLGTTYGGNGQTNFALPDLRGRIPVGALGGSTILGQRGGAEAVTLTQQTMPTHVHQIQANGGQADNPDPTGASFAASNTYTEYTTVVSNVTMRPNMITTYGGNQAHDNMSPYLVLNVCIALQGIFPSRN